MPHIDPDKISQYIKEVAAERIIPRFQNLVEDEINTKSGPSDLVTIADIEAEEDLTKIFKDLIPGSIVIGEEAVSKGEVTIDALTSESGYIWVIDPVDGTHNFAHGKPIFATMVALVNRNETVQSWIYNIPGEEVAIAEKGSGVTLNNTKKTYPQYDEVDLTKLRGFISRKFLPSSMRVEVEKILDDAFGEVDSYKCCGHDYLAILRGDAYYAMYSKIHPWDHLPGALMMEEAGGYLRQWNASNYTAKDAKGGILVTPDQRLWDEIHGKILKQFM